MRADNPAKPSFKPRPPIYHYITMGIALIGVLLIWRQQQAVQLQVRALVAQNHGLQQELKEARSEIENLNSGDSSMAAKARTESVREAIQDRVPMEEQETLSLQPPTVQSAPDRLSVRFSFQSVEGAALPNRLTLVVRVPAGAESKIVSLKPLADPSYSDVECIVDARGKLGMIEGSPVDLQALSFELVVSAPVTALVRGSEGIKDFNLAITADGCTVHPL